MKVLSVNHKANWTLPMLLDEEVSESVPNITYNGFPQRSYEWVPDLDDNGEQITIKHSSGWIEKRYKKRNHVIQHVEPFTFQAKLVYEDYYRGRSSFCMVFRIDGYKRYFVPMAANGVDTLMRAIVDGKIKVVDGKIDGVWKWVKRGSNVSIVPVLDEV